MNSWRVTKKEIGLAVPPPPAPFLLRDLTHVANDDHVCIMYPRKRMYACRTDKKGGEACQNMHAMPPQQNLHRAEPQVPSAQRLT